MARTHSQSERSEFRVGLIRLVSNRLTLAGMVVAALLILAALLAPAVVPYPEDARGFPREGNRFQPPSRTHLFGTDDLGRDLFSRVIWGGRTSLTAGIAVVLIAIGIGVPLGMVAGYFGGAVGEIIMRITDIFLSFPPMLLALAISAALGAGLTNAMIAVGVTWWPWYARLMRAQIVSLREKDFVESARAIGVSPFRILLRHIFPNCLAPITVQATLDVGYAILMTASLSFIGLGAQAPTPCWGLLVNIGRKYFLECWWYATFPGLFIFASVLAFNLMGDGIRDLLDPRLRRQ
ncbi:MAG: ABC transporter permease [Bacillota bacterium]